MTDRPPEGPRERVEEALALAESRAGLNAFITLTPDIARAAAARLERRRRTRRSTAGAKRERRRRPGSDAVTVAGWTVALKDLIDLAGTRTSAGGARPLGARVDAPVASRLRQGGALIIGKSNMDEWGLSASGRNATWGDCRNPHDESRLAGGSSSGSAAAVAAGICRLGIGTDTAGSLRIPASFCGVTALKPSVGALDQRGILGLAPSLDSVGPITRSAADCATAFVAMGGSFGAARGKPAGPVRGRTIGIARGAHWETVDDEVGGALEESLRTFEAAGVRLVEVEVPLIAEATRVAGVVLLYEVSHRHSMRWRHERARLAPHVIDQLAAAAEITVSEYRSALIFREAWRGRVGALFNGIDALLHATTSRVAFSASEKVTTHELTRLTSAWNLGGGAVLAMPCGRSRDGLPISASLVSPPVVGRLGAGSGSSIPARRRTSLELIVLRLGQAYQRRTEWHL